MLYQEMEAYIRGLIPNLAQLCDMPAQFVQMYCRIAAHKFFFFCDPQRRGLPWFSFRKQYLFIVLFQSSNAELINVDQSFVFLCFLFQCSNFSSNYSFSVFLSYQILLILLDVYLLCGLRVSNFWNLCLNLF